MLVRSLAALLSLAAGLSQASPVKTTADLTSRQTGGFQNAVYWPNW